MDGLPWAGCPTAIRFPNQFVTAGGEPFGTRFGAAGPSGLADRAPFGSARCVGPPYSVGPPRRAPSAVGPSGTIKTACEHRPTIASKLPALTVSSRQVDTALGDAYDAIVWTSFRAGLHSARTAPSPAVAYREPPVKEVLTASEEAPQRMPLRLLSSNLLVEAAALGILLCTPDILIAESASPRFETHIAPILTQHCYSCHGPGIQQSELDLQSRDAILVGGKSGPAIVPRDPVASLLMQKVASGSMPPGDSNLGVDQIELIRTWIETGALSVGHTPAVSDQTHAGAGVSPRKILVTTLNLKCLLCHGRRRQEGGLDIRTRDSLLRGGVSGPAIVPGKPDESLLIQRIVAEEMPPAEHQSRLSYRPVTSAELQELRRWIADGAPFEEEVPQPVRPGSDPLVSDDDRQFWSFQPPLRPPVPVVRGQDLIRTPIDAFLLAELEARELSFSPEAERLTLMRRAYFDVIGLPPSPAEVEAFLADKNPRAYERLVDRLLESPRHGEHWARRWLDAAGYADSEGQADADAIRPHAWRYRDWVIRALNADKPYDRFLTEQIAGDELFDYKARPVPLSEEERSLLVATGFMRMGPDGTYSVSQGFVGERMTVVADQLRILTSTVMGLTIGCARCHDHKYDPVPLRDYYRFSAILRSAYDPYDWLSPNEVGVGPDADWHEGNTRMLLGVPSHEIQEAERLNAPIHKEVSRLEGDLESLTAPFRDQLQDQKWAGIPESLRADILTSLDTPPQERTEIQEYLAAQFGSTLEVSSDELRERFPDYRQKAIEIEAAILKTKRRLRPKPRIRALFDMGGKPTPVHVLYRGSHRDPGPLVDPGVPSMLSSGLAPYGVEKPPWTTGTSGRRLALAKWLAQPRHPLTARVRVNWIWQHYFGRGIVQSQGNFGRTGTPPTHPELLDWLATEFVASGWSMRAIHRLILTSAAYRQSSFYDRTRHGQDPDNVLLSRFPLRRLDADAIRDSILSVSGRLNPTPFGPPDDIEARPDGEVVAKDSPEGMRRSIYLLQRRSKPLTMLESFDAPQLRPNCLRRTHSTVPSQALQLMNSDALRTSSRFMAGRVIDAAGDDPAKQVERVYLAALSRSPTDGERASGVSALARMTQAWTRQLEEGPAPMEPKESRARWLALAALCHTMLNSAEFLYID